MEKRGQIILWKRDYATVHAVFNSIFNSSSTCTYQQVKVSMIQGHDLRAEI